ncbi:MAG: hypothetical protein GXO70_07520, partial [Acidobacteria bacterium]|nr:hypothetical protein [Acidobacteriota bacterium]
MTHESHKHDEDHENELEQVVVNEVIRVLENIFKEHNVEELFEFSDEELIEGMKRFVKLYETDRWTAMAGMMMSSMVTTDVFFQVMEQEEEEGKKEEEE